MAIKVYRAGLMEPGTDTHAGYDIKAAADRRKPASHPQTRTGALFASPTLHGSARWVDGKASVGQNSRCREITLHPGVDPYVYPVDGWEAVSWGAKSNERRMEAADAYWAAGMPLSQWLARADTDGLDGRQWEVLVAPAMVKNHRNVSAKRLLAAEPDEYLRNALERVVRHW